MIVLHALVQTPFPAHTFLFYQISFLFAKIDILSGENFFADNFGFVETDPYTPILEQMGFETKNFMINSVSFFPVLLGIIGWFVVKLLTNKICTYFYFKNWAREVGIWAF